MEAGKLRGNEGVGLTISDLVCLVSYLVKLYIEREVLNLFISPRHFVR